MATITPYNPTIAGVDPDPVTPDAENTVANPSGGVILRVSNSGGSTITVTVPAAIATRPADGTYPAMATPDIEVQVPDGESRVIGPIPPAYTDPSTGRVTVQFSGTSDVLVDAMQL